MVVRTLDEHGEVIAHRFLMVCYDATAQDWEDASAENSCELCPGFWLRAEWLWQTPLPDSMECLKQILQSCP